MVYIFARQKREKASICSRQHPPVQNLANWPWWPNGIKCKTTESYWYCKKRSSGKQITNAKYDHVWKIDSVFIVDHTSLGYLTRQFVLSRMGSIRWASSIRAAGQGLVSKRILRRIVITSMFNIMLRLRFAVRFFLKRGPGQAVRQLSCWVSPGVRVAVIRTITGTDGVDPVYIWATIPRFSHLSFPRSYTNPRVFSWCKINCILLYTRR